MHAYRDYKRFLAQKCHPKTSLILTSRQDWLGIAKPKNVFRSTIEVMKFLKISYLAEFSTDALLTNYNAFRQAFNVTSSRDMPFCQRQQLQCLHHGSTKAYLCSLCAQLISPLYTE